MAYRDVTDAAAVISAMKEFDRLGRELFLAKYGFGRGLDYFVTHDCRLYDAKALLGAAHGHQYGSPLAHADFVGGVATAQVLAGMGFRVEGPLFGAWNTAIGGVVTKTQMKQQYGGTIYGGIEPSTTTANVLVYSDPAEGRKYGYDFDGWSVNEPSVFYYMGEGQLGDQTMTDGNLNLLTAAQKGQSVRLFEAAGPKQRGGKPYRYIGEMYVDNEDPWRREDAQDKIRAIRSVIVFKLHLIGPPGLVPTSQLRAGEPSETGSVVVVPPETNRAETFGVSGSEGGEATRREAKLMRALEEELSGAGHNVMRLRIIPSGQSASLVTDTFDETANVLYEIKASARRGDVRMALGQLLDYARYAPTGTRLVALFPVRPADDLVGLLHLSGIGVSVMTKSGVVNEAPPAVQH